MPSPFDAAPLDLDRIRSETFVASVEHHASISSTNDRAAQCAASTDQPLPRLIVADGQTAGRGRGSNRWWTGPGGLAFSLLLTAEQAGALRHRSPLAALAAAVSVVETVRPLVAGQDVGLHWPNDVMAAGRKLSGILVEVLPGGLHIVGIGVNVNNSSADAPAELRPLVATLRDLTGRFHDPTAMLVALLERLEVNFAQLARDAEQIAAEAHALCLQRGQTLTIELGGQQVQGRCAGIGPDGALRLDTPEGPRSLYSGVVCKQPSL